MPFIPRAARLSGQYDVGSSRRLIIVHDGLRVSTGFADDANRRRMAGRLAPGSPSRWLWLDLVAPVRNATRNHGALALPKGRAPTPQEFNELADAASADSLVARRFALDGGRFVRGDHPRAAALKATLASRNNHDRFAAVARGEPTVEAALPISADIAALTEIGLHAVAAIEIERAQAMVRVISANHRSRRLPLGMVDLNVAGSASILISTSEVNCLKAK